MARTNKKQLSDDEIAQSEEDRKNAPEEDVTHFEEDDDPTQYVGDVVEDESEDEN